MKIDFNAKKTELEAYSKLIEDASKPTEEEKKILGWVAKVSYMYLRACFVLSESPIPYSFCLFRILPPTNSHCLLDKWPYRTVDCWKWITTEEWGKKIFICLAYVLTFVSYALPLGRVNVLIEKKRGAGQYLENLTTLTDADTLNVLKTHEKAVVEDLITEWFSAVLIDSNITLTEDIRKVIKEFAIIIGIVSDWNNTYKALHIKDRPEEEMVLFIQEIIDNFVQVIWRICNATSSNGCAFESEIKPSPELNIEKTVIERLQNEDFLELMNLLADSLTQIEGGQEQTPDETLTQLKGIQEPTPDETLTQPKCEESLESVATSSAIEEQWRLPDNFSSMTLSNNSEEYFIMLKVDFRKLTNEKIEEFVEYLSEKGYIENTNESKRLFIYRLTGRWRPEGELKKLQWGDQKSCATLAYIVRNTYEQEKSSKKWNKIKDFFDYPKWPKQIRTVSNPRKEFIQKLHSFCPGCYIYK